MEEQDRRSEPRPGHSDRRRASWREFRRAYPGILATMAVAAAALLLMTSYALYKRHAYRGEIERLRGAMTDFERQQTDLLLANQEQRFRVMVELVRRQARLDERLNLSVAVDSGVMYLQREGALLRAMRVEMGPERTVGVPPDTIRMARPLGVRTVHRVVDGDYVWAVPDWVYTQRGLAVPPPDEREVKGALGATAILLDGGVVIYSSEPESGPLANGNYVLPGSVRARPQDLAAIAPNVRAGMTVYFY